MELHFDEAFTERTPRIVRAAKLKRAAARKKEEAFLAEGENAVEAAVATGSASDVFATEDAAHRFAEILEAAANLDCYVHPITEGAARSLADTVTTPGIFALCRPVTWPVREALGRSPRLVSVPVGASEPGNAGTLIRTSDALGADAVVLAGESVDPHNPKVVRASAGSLFHIPVARHTDPAALVDQLHAKGLTVLASASDGELPLNEAGEVLAKPTAWLFGNEAHGLDPKIAALADHRVRIPLSGGAESLNLAAAAAILLYESSAAQAAAAPAGDGAL